MLNYCGLVICARGSFYTWGGGGCWFAVADSFSFAWYSCNGLVLFWYFQFCCLVFSAFSLVFYRLHMLCVKLFCGKPGFWAKVSLLLVKQKKRTKKKKRNRLQEKIWQNEVCQWKLLQNVYLKATKSYYLLERFRQNI